MIRKEKYLLYDPVTDTLNLNQTEHELIRTLTSSPDFKYDQIINDYFGKSESKNEFLERIDEIFSFYYSASPDIVNPGRMFNLTKAWEIIEKLKNDSPRSNKTNNSNRKYSVKQIAFYLYCKDIFFEPGKKTAGIKEIAKTYNLNGHKDLMTQYTNLSKAGIKGDGYRASFLKFKDNQEAVEEMLSAEQDKNALLKLKQHINKLPAST